MKEGPNIAGVASLVGDPARANILSALMDGRALTATELAREAGVTPQTASSHLSKLEKGGLLLPVKQGRHRYYRLSGPDVADVLERHGEHVRDLLGQRTTGYEGAPLMTRQQINGQCVEAHTVVPYRKNTLVLFINSLFAVHGVTPRRPTPHTRKFLNITGDVSEPLFDIAPFQERGARKLVRRIGNKLGIKLGGVEQRK